MTPHTTPRATRAPTGHAHHFLSRLDRVARAHVEIALMLYRDEDLLRFILDRAALPEGVDRVALSLEDPVRGPFLIVTRNARFVTCLGAGMKPWNRRIMTRAQLDGHIARAREMRARNEALPISTCPPIRCASSASPGSPPTASPCSPATVRAPAPKPSEPSRSGPCPCGSGKKYKRCCGDARPGGEMPKAA